MPQSTDAVAQGFLDHLADLHERLRKVVTGLDDAALERAPRAGENSIAVLITHTIGSELGWLHRAAGISFERDRDAEFRARGSADALRALIDTADRLAPDLVRAAIVAGAESPREVGGERGTRKVTVAYCLTHAVVHGSEHVGHAELTRNRIRG